MEDGDNRSGIAFDDEEDGEGKLAEHAPFNWIGLDRNCPGFVEMRSKIESSSARKRGTKAGLRGWYHVNASSMSSCARG